jgi:hypothetical protein
MLKKVTVWGLIGFLVFFVAFRPGAAVAAIAAVGDVCISVFEGVGLFFSDLVS